ncbi:MAG TPA: hypothetical protein VMW16_00490 [Sedimentisphaerales bacterium]|nr:hypothetical protein [Sedimentisphaerales bacterium]
MSTGKQIELLDHLQALLERQTECAQQGSISNVEVLSRRADSLVGEIAKMGILELPEFEYRRARLQKLYDGLCLALAAQRADTAEKLKRIRRGKKTVGVYRENV